MNGRFAPELWSVRYAHYDRVQERSSSPSFARSGGYAPESPTTKLRLVHWATPKRQSEALSSTPFCVVGASPRAGFSRTRRRSPRPTAYPRYARGIFSCTRLRLVVDVVASLQRQGYALLFRSVASLVPREAPSLRNSYRSLRSLASFVPRSSELRARERSSLGPAKLATLAYGQAWLRQGPSSTINELVWGRFYFQLRNKYFRKVMNNWMENTIIY